MSNIPITEVVPRIAQQLTLRDLRRFGHEALAQLMTTRAASQSTPPLEPVRNYGFITRPLTSAQG